MEHGVDIVVHSATKWIGGHGTTLGGIIIDSGRFDWGMHASRFPQFHAPVHGRKEMSFWNRFGPEAFVLYFRFDQLRLYGSTLSPATAQQLLIGLETLSLRCERQASNASTIVNWLQRQSQVAWVSHLGLESHESHQLAKRYNRNGFCSVLTFGVHGGAPAAQRLIDGFRLIINATK